MRSDIVSFRIFIGVFAVHKFVDHKIVDHKIVNYRKKMYLCSGIKDSSS
jgi:hypothetical protein